MRMGTLPTARMHRALAALLPLLLLVPSAQAHPLGGSFSVASPAYVNYLLDHFSWPDLAPGERGPIRFYLNNTYPWRMVSVVLRLEIYKYADLDGTLAVNTSWSYARPSFYDLATGQEFGRRFEANVAQLEPRDELLLSVGVVTDADAPHGTLTKQGSYFVRTSMEFDLTDGATTNRSVMHSLGHFTAAQFATAREPCPDPAPPTVYCEGLLNLTYLGSLKGLGHLDGLLPEGGFSVKDRMPLWPFVAVGGVTVAFLVFAFLFYAEENPGKYPRLAAGWAALKGKAWAVRPPKRK